MKTTKILLIIAILFSNTLFAQVTEAVEKINKVNTDTVSGWKKGGILNISLTQSSFTNWSSGGENSFSVSSIFNSFVIYRKNNSVWESNLDLGYGFLQQGKSGNFLKTDDKIIFTTKYGKKAFNNWYYSALLDIKTQMTPGYHYPNDSIRISDFFAPAYLLGAIGMDYKHEDHFSFFIAPLTGRVTFVMNQNLADAGAFGVDAAERDPLGKILVKGKTTRMEFGGYFRMLYKREIMKNVLFNTKLELFSNYLDNPQNIDVNWETLIGMKVNKLITVTITTQLIYDDDIKISIDKNSDGVPESVGARTQFKEVIAAGVSFKF